jgi:hypothetical protein
MVDEFRPFRSEPKCVPSSIELASEPTKTPKISRLGTAARFRMRQIVSRASEGKDPVHFDPTMAHLPHQCNRLQAAKAFFNPLPLSSADRISGVGCGHQSRCRPVARGSAPPGASPGTRPQTRACQTLCRRPQSPAGFPESAPASRSLPGQRNGGTRRGPRLNRCADRESLLA